MAFYKPYSGTTGVTATVYDVKTDLGTYVQGGYISNTGTTYNLTFAMSNDGVTYGDEVTLPPGYTHNFDRLNRSSSQGNLAISKIRVAIQVTAATTYLIFVE